MSDNIVAYTRYNQFPRVSSKNLTPELFCEILRIYEQTVGAQQVIRQCGLINPRLMQEIQNSLRKDAPCLDFRFGSSLGRHSKLMLYHMRTRNTEYVLFDFDPNTYDDERESVITVRENFLKATRDYIRQKLSKSE